MEPYVLPKLTDFEYKLLMLCKGKYKVKPISVPVDSVFRQYPQFYAFMVRSIGLEKQIYHTPQLKLSVYLFLRCLSYYLNCTLAYLKLVY